MLNGARTTLILFAALALSGCMSGAGVERLASANQCVADAAERVSGVDWLKAEAIELGIRQGAFDPMIIALKRDAPYVIRITNGDDESRYFRANEFFRSIALAKVVTSGEVFDATCISAVGVAANDTAEIQFVAVRDGRYDFEDIWFMYAPIVAGSGHGVVLIQ